VAPVVRIVKSVRRLEVLDGGRVVFACPVALGPAPEGDKRVEGDGRTPEGAFFVCTRNERSRYHRFLGLSYPSPEDAERGLRDRLLTHREALAIGRAAALGRRPPWDTPLGGEIGIHGAGGEPREGDWTRGCVAVDDETMDELWRLCPLGTRVFVEP
jgi:murein L,D-transpeptidase YafK